MANKELSAGEMVGTYRVVRKVGEGGMGEVYEAWDANLNRQVAIKIMNATASADPDLVERFRGEGRVLARLRHSHIVALYAQGDHNGCPYMVMEYIDGQTVDEFLKDHPCSLTALVDFFRQMLEGLGAAHAAGIIHRDIKPQNIIVGTDLQVKIIDFGVAKDHADHLAHQTTVNMVVGTAHYFAPEMVLGKLANPQTDLYSLGLVFFYMVTGEKPFSGKSNLEILEKIRTTDLVLLGKTSTLMPEALRTVFSRMTKRNPALRYRSAKEALDELDAVDLNELPVDLCAAPSPRITIANAAEVARWCKDKQLNYFESRFAVNLALESGKPGGGPANDATQQINTSPVITLSEAAINDGIRRFRAARNTMVSRATMSQPYYLEPQPRRRADLTMPLILIVAFGISFWTYSNMKTSHQTVPTPVAGQTAKPGSTFNPFPLPPDTPAPSRREASTAAPVPVAPQRPAGAPLPEIKIGTNVRMKSVITVNNIVAEEKIRDWQLVSIENGKYLFVASDGSRVTRTRDTFAPPISFFFENARMPRLQSHIMGDSTAIFPLTVGKRHSYDVRFVELVGKKNTSVTTFKYTCEVTAQEKIRVPAGEFDTYKVVCAGDGPPYLKDIYNYSPKFMGWIRRETTDADETEKGRKRVEEVVGYTLPTP